MNDVIESVFPRLIRALQRGCLLTRGEAVGAIYAHRYGDGFAGEAVNSCGGAAASIRQAIRTRGYHRPLYLN